jgi:hypothetical protein
MGTQIQRELQYIGTLPAIANQLTSSHTDAVMMTFTMPALSGIGKAYLALGPDATGTFKRNNLSTVLTLAPSGTPWKIAETWVVLAQDTEAAVKTVAYKTGFTCLLRCDAVTPVVGEDAYIIPMATVTTGALVTNASSGNDLIGKFAEVNGSVYVSNPASLPAGTYAYVTF